MEKAPHPLNPLLKMKILATRERRAQATAAVMAVMVNKLPGTKKTLRRLTLRARNFRNIRPSWLFLYLYIHLVVLFRLNKLFFVNFNLCRSCKLGLRRT
jgi:hypothetical protein